VKKNKPGQQSTGNFQIRHRDEFGVDELKGARRVGMSPSNIAFPDDNI
jgi:hypothetical protein